MATRNPNPNSPAPTEVELETVAEIARRHLHVETLETRGSDGLDFAEQAVWSLRSALLEAHRAGAASASASEVGEAASQGWWIDVGEVTAHGAPQPQIQIRAPRGTSPRALRAVMHLLAAEVELAEAAAGSPASWCVSTRLDHDLAARVCIELADPDDADERALAHEALMLARRSARLGAALRGGRR